MKTYSLIKTKQGERKGKEISIFYGNSITDAKMLKEVQNYLDAWIESYTSISDEEKQELFADFDGNFSYDVWNFSLEEK